MRRSISVLAAAGVLMLSLVAVSRAEPLRPDGGPVAKADSPGRPLRVEELACTDGQKPRLAQFIVYGRDGAHYAFKGPEMMTAQEAQARKTHLELQEAGSAAGAAKVSFGVISPAGTCGFLYLEGPKDKTYGLAQGTRESLALRRNDIVRFGGQVLTPTVCLVEERPSVPVFDASYEYARAHGTSEDSGCAAAQACLDIKAKAQGVMINRSGMAVKHLNRCDCEETAGGMRYCTATGVKTSPYDAAPDGVRG